MSKKTEAVPAICPTCGRRMAVGFYREATVQFTRTCRGCGDKWRVLVKPKRVAGGWVHFLTFGRVEG
jgi:Zn ribbon nucleic-acid-binding protein